MIFKWLNDLLSLARQLRFKKYLPGIRQGYGFGLCFGLFYGRQSEENKTFTYSRNPAEWESFDYNKIINWQKEDSSS